MDVIADRSLRHAEPVRDLGVAPAVHIVQEDDLALNLGQSAEGFEEVVTHEIGHTIGLGHSSENANEPNAALRDATMFFLLHLDGRGTGLRADDVAGVSAIYPSPVDPNDLDGDGVPNANDLCPETPASHGVETVPTVEFDMPSVVIVAPEDGSHVAGRASPRCGCREKSRPFDRMASSQGWPARVRA